MRTEIYFAHKVLILTDTPVEIDDYYRMPSSELSRANVLKIFETTNTIVVLDTMIELYIEQFFSEFKYVEAAGGLVENEKGEQRSYLFKEIEFSVIKTLRHLTTDRYDFSIKENILYARKLFFVLKKTISSIY